jgi:uncharacterized repeat protein (TIGR03803 family)
MGNLYGTTRGGGGNGCGAVFKLVPSQGGQWTESVVYSFTCGQDGAEPVAGVTFDNTGNLYGTTLTNGTYGGGTAFELAPSGSGWTEATLYAFNPSTGEGYAPAAGLILDSSGHLYGATMTGGLGGGGTVFELLPSNGTWSLTKLYSLTGNSGPQGNLTMDATGNLYGATHQDGAYGLGNAFRLTYSNGSWVYNSLHDFTGEDDGASLFGNLILDANGNIYGTASQGGNLNCNAPNGCGVVWQITP